MALSLQQSMTQNLKLTPEQIQVIKMLEIPTVDLLQRINEELQENPMLEVGEEQREEEIVPEENDYSQEDDCSDVFGESTGDEYDPLQNEDFDYSQYVEDDELPDYRYETRNYSPDDEVMDAPIVVGNSFREYLVEQIGMLRISEQQRQVAEYIVGNIDERGYLTRDPEQMVDDLAFHANVIVADAEMVQLVKLVQQLDPPGVGAKDLQDCLRLQLEAKLAEADDEEAKVLLERAKLFVEKHFKELTKHHYEHLSRRYNISMDEVKTTINVINSLNPMPSSAYSGDIYESHKVHIIPDFRVEVLDDDELQVTLLDQDIPPLRVSQDYVEMLQGMKNQPEKKTKEDREAIRFIKEKIDSANWFIDAIKQRNDTLMKTMKAIAAFQKDYFLEGDDSFMKPMILEDVAKATGLDPSTISRVSNSKYVQTEYGVVSLKHFFSESLTNDQGEEVSTREVKRILRQAIEKEDKRQPLNDDKLVALLAVDGYKIARRTVAKYREQLGIPVARLRREA